MWDPTGTVRRGGGQELQKGGRDLGLVACAVPNYHWAFAVVAPPRRVEVIGAALAVFRELHVAPRAGAVVQIVHQHDVAPKPVAGQAEQIVFRKHVRAEVAEEDTIAAGEAGPQLSLRGVQFHVGDSADRPGRRPEPAPHPRRDFFRKAVLGFHSPLPSVRSLTGPRSAGPTLPIRQDSLASPVHVEPGRLLDSCPSPAAILSCSSFRSTRTEAGATNPSRVAASRDPQNDQPNPPINHDFLTDVPTQYQHGGPSPVWSGERFDQTAHGRRVGLRPSLEQCPCHAGNWPSKPTQFLGAMTVAPDEVRGRRTGFFGAGRAF